METTTYYWMFAGLAAMTGVIVDFCYRSVKAMLDMGKVWTIILPGSPGAEAVIKRRKLKDGGLFQRKNGEEKDNYLAAGLAAYPTRKGPLHILTDYGANLVAPSKDEVYKNLEAANLEEAKVKFQEQVKKDNLQDNKAAQESLWAKLVKEAKHVSMRFLVHDPLIYYRACKENVTEDYYMAQQGKKHWMEVVAPWLAISVLALVGLVGFMLWKVLPIISQRAAQG